MMPVILIGLALVAIFVIKKTVKPDDYTRKSNDKGYTPPHVDHLKESEKILSRMHERDGGRRWDSYYNRTPDGKESPEHTNMKNKFPDIFG